VIRQALFDIDRLASYMLQAKWITLLAAPLLPDVLRCGAGGGSCQARLQI
jgi:hypothetical protein